MSQIELVEDFYGVYLLYNINPKFKGRTYVGYTRDPNRRIMQHNRGTWAGGANRTSNRGPWKMAMVVHGFPNNISALRFEWAWQNPSKTTRLQHLNLKKIPRKESEFQFKIRILLEMLCVGPWCRLPLVIRWLESEFFQDFPVEKKPPDHMIVRHGPIKTRNLKKNTQDNYTEHDGVKCLLCANVILEAKSKLTCLNPNCDLITHITCLADIFLKPGDLIPIEGDCPFCCIKLKWGDLIRKMKGCSQSAFENVANDCDEQNDSDEDMISTQDKQFVDNNSHWLVDCDDDL